MNNSPSVGQLGVILARFLPRYHITLYTMTIVIAVSVAIFLISSVTSSSDDVDAKVVETTKFDTNTIDRIKEYNSSSQAAKPFSLPGSGRINPFVE